MKRDKKLWQKMLSVLLIICLVLPGGISYGKTPALTYKDISGHWAEAIINEFVSEGWISGYSDGTYRPDAYIVRSELMSLILKVMELKGIPKNSHFSDVKTSDWFYNDANYAFEKSYMKGYADGTFRPKQPVSRYEAAVVLTNLLNIKATPKRVVFTDASSFPSWASDSVYALAEKGVISGYSDKTYRGKNYITRGEVIKLLKGILPELIALGIKENQPQNQQTPQLPTGASVGTLLPPSGGMVAGGIVTPPVVIPSPVLNQVTPTNGEFGSVITLQGNHFGTDIDGITVIFHGAKQGEMKMVPLTLTNTSLTVLVPGIVNEAGTVSIKKGQLSSETKSFQFTGFGDVASDDTIIDETKQSLEDIVLATQHEIGIGLTPFTAQTTGTVMDEELTVLMNQVNTSLSLLTQGKTPEERELMSQILNSPTIRNQLALINQSAEILSHSTTSEALGNIAQAKRLLQEVKTMLDNIAWMIEMAQGIAAAAAVAASIYLDFATATLMTDIAANLESILTLAIDPAREAIGGILSILDMAPTKAVQDSLVITGYQNDTGIDQYFNNLEVNYATTEPGPFYMERTNKLISAMVLIESDLRSMIDRERLGQNIAEDIQSIVDEDHLFDATTLALNAAKGLSNKGAVQGYTDKIGTIESIKTYARQLQTLKVSLKQIRDQSQAEAENYAGAALFNKYTALELLGFSLEKKMSIILDTDEALTGNSLAASRYYNVYTASKMLVSRTLEDTDFHIFDNYTVEYLASGGPLQLPFINQGSLASKIESFVRRVGRVTTEEIQGIQGVKPVNEEMGALYVTEPYFFKGHVDYTSRDNDFLRVENILSASGNSLNNLSGGNFVTRIIVKLIMRLADEGLDDLLKIDLTDVEVPLKVTFINADGTERTTSELIQWEWISGTQVIDGIQVTDKLMLQGIKPGEETIMITPVLVEANIDLEKVKALYSIKRKIKVVSGHQTIAPYTGGPELDAVVNLTTLAEAGTTNGQQGYIGDQLKLTGFGFVNNNVAHQNVFFGSAAAYNPLGQAAKWQQNQNAFQSLQVEVPDATTGQLCVAVGTGEGTLTQWPSNKKDFEILSPRIDLISSTAIRGEAWPVWGRGFSHDATYNIGVWGSSTSTSSAIMPPALDNPLGPKEIYPTPDASTHSTVDVLHNRLDFIVPANSQTSLFHINTIGTLNTTESSVLVRSFSPKATLSDLTRDGLRPSITQDNTTGTRVAVWIDANEHFGNQLMASIIQTNGAASVPTIISQNIGGIMTAPEPPVVVADNGLFVVTWTSLVNGNDEIFMSQSSDGITWSAPVNVSNSPTSASIEPAMDIKDMNQDGDSEIAIAWTEAANASVHLALFQNNQGVLESYNQSTIAAGSSFSPDVAMDNQTVSVIYVREVNGFNRVAVSAMNWQTRLVIGQPQFISAEGIDAASPQCVYNINPRTGKNGLAIVFESFEKVANGVNSAAFKEDIIFARLEDGEVDGLVNLTQSKVHSQSPTIDNDANNDLAISWIEQGFDTYDPAFEDGFDAKIIFARSFNGGESFNRPYKVIAAYTESTRLGHISMIAKKDAEITLLWQKDGKNQNTRVEFVTTVGTGTAPASHPGNTVGDRRQILGASEGLLQTEAGAFYRNIHLRNRMEFAPITSSYVDFSPSGRYLAATDGTWVMEAESDGSNPIGIYARNNDNAHRIYWSPTEEVIAADYVENGLALFNRTSKNLLDTSVGHVVYNHPWFGNTIYSEALEYTYQSRQDGNGQPILVGTVVKAAIHQIENNGAVDTEITGGLQTYPVIAPNGKMMVWISHPDGDKLFLQISSPLDFKGKLMFKKMDTGTDTAITSDYKASKPVWSPDSSRLAYILEESTGSYVYIMDAHFANRVSYKLTDAVNNPIHIRFSSNGKAIYVRKMDGTSVSIDIQTHAVTALAGYPWNDLFVNRPEGLVHVSGSEDALDEGASDQITYTLNQQPTAPVTLNLEIGSGMTLNKTQLEFTQDNWQIGQVVTYQSVDDQVYEGDRLKTIRVEVVSNDIHFDRTNAPAHFIQVIEDEDIVPPTWTNGVVTATRTGDKTIQLAWSGAADPSGIHYYNILVDGSYETSTPNLTISLNVEEHNQDYTIKIEAVDNFGNETLNGPSTIVNLSGTDIRPPVWQNAVIEIEDLGGRYAHITWSQATDMSDIHTYQVYLDGQLVQESLSREAWIRPLNKGTAYEVKIEAVDGVNNQSTDGPQLQFTTASSETFYLGIAYAQSGYEQGAGQPVASGWTRQSVYSGLLDRGMEWRYDVENASGVVLGKEGTYYFVEHATQDNGTDYLVMVNPNGTLKTKVAIQNIAPYSEVAPTVDANGNIIIVGEVGVSAYSDAGVLLWTFTPDSSYVNQFGQTIAGDKLIPGSVGIGSDGAVYVTATNPTVARLVLYKVNAGSKVWRYTSSIYSTNSTQNVGNTHTSPVPLQNTKILFGNELVNAEGTHYRTLATNSTMVAAPGIVDYNGAITLLTRDYVDSPKGEWYRFDGTTGDLLQSLIIDAPAVYGHAVDFDGNSYVGTLSGKMMKIDTEGHILWETQSNESISGAPLLDIAGNSYWVTHLGKCITLTKNGTVSGTFDGDSPVHNGSPVLNTLNQLAFMGNVGLYVIGNNTTEALGFEVSSQSVNEDATQVVVQLRRQGNLKGQRIVTIGVDSTSTATSNDLEYTGSQVVFEDGEATKTVTLVLKEDQVPDGNKKIVLNIESILGGSVLGQALHTVYIIDNEVIDQLSLEFETYSVNENANEVTLKVIRTVSGAQVPTVTVQYLTQANSAKAGIDYTATSGTLTFAPDEFEKLITVPLINNATYSGNRNFMFVLKNQSQNVTLGYYAGQVTIVEDDSKPNIDFEIVGQTVSESAGTITVEVVRSGDLTPVSGVYIELNFALSTIDPDVDIQRLGGIYLEFASGESRKQMTLQIIDDSDQELKETVILDLSNPVNANNGTQWRYTLEITDND